MLNHDDSVNDRGPGSKLSTSDKTTRELWTNTFKSDFAKNGSMFRGDPPDLHIIPVPLDFSYKLATKVSRFETGNSGEWLKGTEAKRENILCLDYELGQFA